nr:unnamed protein product [Callosobruchus chinensis]
MCYTCEEPEDFNKSIWHITCSVVHHIEISTIHMKQWWRIWMELMLDDDYLGDPYVAPISYKFQLSALFGGLYWKS